MLTELEKLGNRSEIQGPPAPAFELDALPEEVVRAFPKLAAWQQAQNQKFKAHALKMNQTLTQLKP